MVLEQIGTIATQNDKLAAKNLQILKLQKKIRQLQKTGNYTIKNHP